MSLLLVGCTSRSNNAYREARAASVCDHAQFCQQHAGDFVGYITVIRALDVGYRAVYIIDPIVMRRVVTGEFDDCPRCVIAHSSTMQTSLMLLQTIVFGDGWVVYALPYIKDTPHVVILFIGCHITIMVGLMNLVLATIRWREAPLDLGILLTPLSPLRRGPPSKDPILRSSHPHFYITRPNS